MLANIQKALILEVLDALLSFTSHYRLAWDSRNLVEGAVDEADEVENRVRTAEPGGLYGALLGALLDSTPWCARSCCQ